MTTTPAAMLAENITAVERTYEYMLAYAAQGRRSDVEGNQASTIRELLGTACGALDRLAQVKPHDLGIPNGPSADGDGFVAVLREDAKKARAILGVVLAQPAISSLMIDNLNASVHLRALLTDLFVVNSAVKAGQFGR